LYGVGLLFLLLIFFQDKPLGETVVVLFAITLVGFLIIFPPFLAGLNPSDSRFYYWLFGSLFTGLVPGHIAAFLYRFHQYPPIQAFGHGIFWSLGLIVALVLIGWVFGLVN
jgi:hypothetical protein